ncbi:MAG TPA: hypothetical protein VFJ19_12440 [Nocardioidaceae bacterium]|nr:hypothetical protein [Nocardioidaceae bacterium]
MNRPMSLTGHAIEHLSSDFEPWLSCDDCFDQVDQMIEGLALHGLPIRGAFRAHLRGCPACREEARALLTVVAEDAGLDVAGLVAQFDEFVLTR